MKITPKCKNCQWYTFGATPPLLDQTKHICDHPARRNRTIFKKSHIGNTSPKCCPIRANWDGRLDGYFTRLMESKGKIIDDFERGVK